MRRAAVSSTPRRRMASSGLQPIRQLTLVDLIELRPVADLRSVGDEPNLFAPIVQLIAGRLEREGQRLVGAEIERHLVRRTRRCAGNRPGKPAFDRTMYMAAADPLDPRVVTDDLGKIGAAAEAHVVHGCDPGPKRRVVHQDQCRPIGCCRQRIVDPLQPVAEQFSTGFTRYKGIKPDKRSGYSSMT